MTHSLFLISYASSIYVLSVQCCNSIFAEPLLNGRMHTNLHFPRKLMQDVLLTDVSSLVSKSAIPYTIGRRHPDRSKLNYNVYAIDAAQARVPFKVLTAAKDYVCLSPEIQLFLRVRRISPQFFFAFGSSP